MVKTTHVAATMLLVVITDEAVMEIKVWLMLETGVSE
jgi:hypothetical protein